MNLAAKTPEVVTHYSWYLFYLILFIIFFFFFFFFLEFSSLLRGVCLYTNRLVKIWNFISYGRVCFFFQLFICMLMLIFFFFRHVNPSKVILYREVWKSCSLYIHMYIFLCVVVFWGGWVFSVCSDYFFNKSIWPIAENLTDTTAPGQ